MTKQNTDSYLTEYAPPLTWSVVLSIYVGTPLHELGHWIMAKYLGYNAKWTGFDHITVDKDTPYDALLFIAPAGPLFAMACGMFILVSGFMARKRLRREDKNKSWRKSFSICFIGMGFLMVVMSATNLIPMSDGAKLSDGAYLIQGFKRYWNPTNHNKTF